MTGVQTCALPISVEVSRKWRGAIAIGGETAAKKDFERSLSKTVDFGLSNCFLEAVGQLPNTKLTVATVDRCETVQNGRFLRET